jgi:hypothetical protein
MTHVTKVGPLAWTPEVGHGNDPTKTWEVVPGLVICQQFAMENGPFIDGLPIKNGDFP